MANTIKERPLDPIFSELSAMGAKPNGPLWEFIRFIVQSSDKTLTTKGEIQAKANVTGRTEPLSTTVGNLDAAGIVKAAGADFSRAYVNKDTDHITDGTGSPLSGGKRGFVALDANNRLSGSFRANAVNIAGTPTGSTGLSNDGVSTSITVAAQSQQFGDGTVSYNSGSVDPGSFGTWYIFADDPTFAGGAVTYQFSSTPVNQTANNGRVLFGKITTVGGSAKTGGGNTGGTTSGGAGGRGFIQ